MAHVWAGDQGGKITGRKIDLVPPRAQGSGRKREGEGYTEFCTSMKGGEDQGTPPPAGGRVQRGRIREEKVVKNSSQA